MAGDKGAAPNKRILNKGRPIVEGIMQLDGLLDSLPLLRLPAEVSVGDGRLVKDGSRNLSTGRVRVLGAWGLSIPFWG